MDEYLQVFAKDPNDILTDDMTDYDKIKSQNKPYNQVLLMNEFQKALIDVLKGIHYELKRLNDTNPSNQAQAKPKQDKKNHLNQKLYLRWYS